MPSGAAASGIQGSAGTPGDVGRKLPMISGCAALRATVATVTVNGTAPLPVMLTLAGFTLQVEFCGAPLQVSVITPLKPATGASERLNVAVWPAATVWVVLPPEAGARVKSGTTPPVRAMVTGLL